MGNKGLVLLDTKAIDHAIELRDQILSEYNDINSDFDSIKNELLRNWKGRGADAFKRDADTVRSNIGSLNDVLKTMCDTLEDCKDIFTECDTALGEYNRNPEQEEK